MSREGRKKARRERGLEGNCGEVRILLLSGFQGSCESENKCANDLQTALCVLSVLKEMALGRSQDMLLQLGYFGCPAARVLASPPFSALFPDSVSSLNKKTHDRMLGTGSSDIKLVFTSFCQIVC